MVTHCPHAQMGPWEGWSSAQGHPPLGRGPPSVSTSPPATLGPASSLCITVCSKPHGNPSLPLPPGVLPQAALGPLHWRVLMVDPRAGEGGQQGLCCQNLTQRDPAPFLLRSSPPQSPALWKEQEGAGRSLRLGHCHLLVSQHWVPGACKKHAQERRMPHISPWGAPLPNRV